MEKSSLILCAMSCLDLALDLLKKWIPVDAFVFVFYFKPAFKDTLLDQPE